MKTCRMFEMSISDRDFFDFDMLISSIKREARFCGGIVNVEYSCNRVNIAVAVVDRYKEYFIARIREEIAEFIAVEYKFRYLIENINLPTLSQKESVAFCSALAVFDKSTDKKYINEHLIFGSEIFIDSAVAFCMPLLFERWKEIASLVCDNKFELSTSGGSMEMMRFLLKSSPSETGKIHLLFKNNKFLIVNESTEVLFSFDCTKDNEPKLIHRVICLLPKQLALHGNEFQFFESIFPKQCEIQV